MRVLVFGSGAIGGLVGAGLIDAGADVALLDRGPQYTALKSSGLRLVDREERMRTLTSMRVVREPAEFPHADLVILAVKAHQIAPALVALEKAVAGDATLLTLQNGIPWWYFHGARDQFAGRALRSVDCDGMLASRIDPQRIVGCIAYPASELVEPGLVRHVEGDRLPIGELDGSRSTRCTEISALLERAGFKSPVLDDLRSEIWVKAWGTLAFNPVSALTGMTMAEICQSRDTRALVVRMMTEARDIAARLGVTMRVPLEKRLLGAERVGSHKTSMLQDLEAGRPLEIEAILGAIVELGELVGTQADSLRSVLELARAIDPARQAGSGAGAAVEAAVAS